jgi:hypothetical protein
MAPKSAFEKDNSGNVKDSIKLRLLQQYYKSEDVNNDSTMSIISMNLNLSMYKVFGANGILMNQINYSKQVKKYGLPIAVSPDGLNFIFKKNDDQVLIMKARGELNEN